MLSIIVAKSKNNVIGKDNKIEWDIPEDRKRFEKITTGHNIIMGRKTFESLGRILPKRKHIVFSKDPSLKYDNENVKVVHELSELKNYIESEEENFVIGGAMIYAFLMPYCSRMYVTEINQKYEGDAYFPLIDDEQWKIVKEEPAMEKDEKTVDYKFITYARKR